MVQGCGRAASISAAPCGDVEAVDFGRIVNLGCAQVVGIFIVVVLDAHVAGRQQLRQVCEIELVSLKPGLGTCGWRADLDAADSLVRARAYSTKTRSGWERSIIWSTWFPSGRH